MQSYSYSTNSIHSLILRLFEKYVSILEGKFGKRFENVSFVPPLSFCARVDVS